VITFRYILFRYNYKSYASKKIYKIELTLTCWRKLVCEGEERDGRSKLRCCRKSDV